MKGETSFDGFIHATAASSRRRIGIGILRPDDAVQDSLRRAQAICDVVAFGAVSGLVGSVPAEHPEEAMATALADGSVDALVRGQADAITLRGSLAAHLNCDPGQIRDLALLRDRMDRTLALCPVSHRQGWTVDEKEVLVRDAAALLQRLRLPVKVGVTSGARPGSLGLDPALDRTFSDAEALVGRLRKEMPIAHYFIDLDKAADDGCTVLVTVNGMVGNGILRALAFLGGVKVYGGIMAGIDRIIVESFRSSAGFSDYLEFAAALANLP
jgi:predicted methyltransferase MtxX (methanogen marker protein 4)